MRIVRQAGSWRKMISNSFTHKFNSESTSKKFFATLNEITLILFSTFIIQLKVGG